MAIRSNDQNFLVQKFFSLQDHFFNQCSRQILNIFQTRQKGIFAFSQKMLFMSLPEKEKRAPAGRGGSPLSPQLEWCILSHVFYFGALSD